MIAHLMVYCETMRAKGNDKKLLGSVLKKIWLLILVSLILQPV